MPLLQFLILFLLILIPQSVKGSSEHQTFFALSSLRFFVEEQQKSPSDIPFSQKDIEALWLKAENGSHQVPEIKSAHHFYKLAVENAADANLSKEYYKLIAVELLGAWKKMQNLILNGNKAHHTCLSFILSQKEQSKKEGSLNHNRFISSEMKKIIKPYLIPSDHPMKCILDRIFLESRASENEDTMDQAEFHTLSSRPLSFLTVASHPDMPGYLLKLCLDSEYRKKEEIPAWIWLIRRCQGAENIRLLIHAYKLKYFTVPNKWIYVLPEKPLPSQHLDNRQPLLLLVDDMNLVSHKESVRAWKEVPTKKHIEELYCIISHGYASTCLDINIPYCRNGTFSCIDTEHPKRKLNYEKINRYLSPEMSEYWDYLVRNGGP